MTIYRQLPDGTVKFVDRPTLREAGKHVAYCLADNTRANKQEATKAAMQLEREKHVEAFGYKFWIES